MKIQVDLGKRTWKFELSSTTRDEAREASAEGQPAHEQAAPTYAVEGRSDVMRSVNARSTAASPEASQPAVTPQAQTMPDDLTDGLTDEQLFAVTYGYGEPPAEDLGASGEPTFVSGPGQPEEPIYTPGPGVADEPAVPAKPKRKWLKRVLIGTFVIVTMPFLWFAYLFGLIVWTLKIGGIIR